MRIARTLAALFLVLVVLAACAPGPNSMVDKPTEEGEVAGFWKGLWHGIIAPITFIISLFTRNVAFYEVHNNGNWYNFGFVLGAGILTGGGMFGSRKRKKHECE
jgi:LPXTG-motif cell wall-anchored protein